MKNKLLTVTIVVFLGLMLGNLIYTNKANFDTPEDGTYSFGTLEHDCILYLQGNVKELWCEDK